MRIGKEWSAVKIKTYLAAAEDRTSSSSIMRGLGQA
jgi:hypothetical protein